MAEEALRHAQAASLELSQSLAACKGRSEAARTAADAAGEKLASCRRELEGVERQRAEAEAVISKARPNVESFEAEIAEATEKLEEAKRRQVELSEELAPLRREAHRVSDSLAEAKLAAATLAERTTYAERVLEARARDLEALGRPDGRAPRPAAGEEGLRGPHRAFARPLRRSHRPGPALDALPGGPGERRRERLEWPAYGGHRGSGEGPMRPMPSSTAPPSASPRPACRRAAWNFRWRPR